MKYFNTIICFVLLTTTSSAQSKRELNDLNQWEKSVFNIETESLLLPQYVIDSIYKSDSLAGFNKERLDSVNKRIHATNIGTGTAIFIQFGNRKYFITARHVLFDPVIETQKKYENDSLHKNLKYNESIFLRLSIRTSNDYYTDSNKLNNFAIFPFNFGLINKPFFFISDSTGDGLAIVSLQDNVFNGLEKRLNQNGYLPINISYLDSVDDFKELDEVYVIGYPEMVSVVRRGIPPPNVQISQLLETVVPFIVKGTIAMHNKNVQHFYIDATITPGNSGSPVLAP